MEPIIIDAKTLQKLGLYHKAIYTVEYDLPRESAKYNKETNQFLRHMRWNIVYRLRQKMRAVRNLDSSWFIEQDKLDEAVKLVEEMRSEYLSHTPSFNMDKRIRILSLFTTPEGYESFEDRKAEYLLQIISEAQEKVEKGIQDQAMSETVLWRCKQTIEHVECVSPTLAHHSQHNIIEDSLVMLNDSINEYENLKETKREAKRKNGK